MLRHPTSRFASLVFVIALSLAIAAVPVLAQTSTQPTPTPPPADRPMGEKSTSGLLEGSVKKVDPAAQTVQVSSGLFGIMGRTLEVNDQTQIQVEGRQGTLADIREGTKVKAAYESRDGKNLATRIEVVQTPRSSAPSSSSPTMGASPGGSTSPSSPSTK